MSYDPYDPNQNQMGGGDPTGPDDYVSTDPFAGQGPGAPGHPGTFDNQSNASDPVAAAWKIGMAIPSGYETYHPYNDPAKLAIRRAQSGATAGPPPPSGPIKIGDQTTFNDQTYTWNGKTWDSGAADGAGTTGAAASGPYTGDPTNVDAYLAWLATQPGHDPILDTPQGQAYYKQRITETGGLSAQNLDYWKNKGTLSSAGGAVGAPEGGGSNGDLWQHMPTLADIQGIPGYQAAIDEATRGFNTGAASKGTLLNGRTQSALGSAVSNKVLSDFYFPFAQQQYQNTANNANNLYNLANLGLNGSSVGAA